MDLKEALAQNEALNLPDYQFVRYAEMIDNGESRQMALMLAMRTSPMMGESDRSFCETRHRVMGEMNADNRKNVLASAHKAGINTNGKYYMGGLGRYNDPRAWVGSVDEAKGVCREKNLTAKGLFNIKGREVDPPKKVKLAPDLQEKFIQRELQNPKTAEKARRSRHGLAALREKVIAEHGGRD